MTGAPTQDPATSPLARDRKERLIAAGLALFDEMPFRDVTIDTVAERAGVARGLVAYYFGNKDGLYEAVRERFSETVQARLLENRQADPAEWLETDVRTFLSVVADHPTAMRNTTAGKPALPMGNTRMSAFTVAHFLQVLGDAAGGPMLELVIASWGISCLDLALRWLDQPQIPRDDIAAVMVEQLRAGLAAVARAHPEYGLPVHPFA